MALLIVSHDLGVIAEQTDEIAVMYAGRIVEQGTAGYGDRLAHCIRTHAGCSPRSRTWTGRARNA